MRFIVSVLLMALFSFLAGIFLPWWSIAVICFLVALFVRQPFLRSFLAGFLAIFLTWGILSLVIDLQNDHILSRKVARMFSFGESSGLLILMTALIGGIVGGLAAWCGSTLRPLPKR